MLPDRAQISPTSPRAATVPSALRIETSTPGTARSDFFITVGPVPGFDAGPQSGGDNLGFAAFGHVVKGMDVVRKIGSTKTGPQDRPVKDVVIESVKIRRA